MINLSLTIKDTLGAFGFLLPYYKTVSGHEFARLIQENNSSLQAGIMAAFIAAQGVNIVRDRGDGIFTVTKARQL